MNKKVNVLKKIGQKTAEASIGTLCIPFMSYQPAVPAKLRERMKDKK